MMRPDSGLLWSPWFRRAGCGAARLQGGAGCRPAAAQSSCGCLPACRRALGWAVWACRRCAAEPCALLLPLPKPHRPLQDHRRKLPGALVGRPGRDPGHRQACGCRHHPPHPHLMRYPKAPPARAALDPPRPRRSPAAAGAGADAAQGMNRRAPGQPPVPVTCVVPPTAALARTLVEAGSCGPHPPPSILRPDTAPPAALLPSTSKQPPG